MIVPLLMFIAVGLTSYAGFLKLARAYSPLQRVVEVRFPFRRHYDGHCHFRSCPRSQRVVGDKDRTQRRAVSRSGRLR